MERTYIEHQIFEKLNFSENPIAKGEYEHCTFVNCNFANADLTNRNFTACEFMGCNLSMSKFGKTVMSDVHFKDCKLLGLTFENCNEFLFSITVEHCTLNLSSFYKMNLKKTTFKHSSLQEVDFTESNLTGSLFDHCDLMRTTFKNTILEKVDFRTSYNYSIDPELNRLKKAKFSTAGVVGLLDKYDIDID
jgi:uncharacterized protein YjbI with pentapeptide repeats